MIEPMTRHLKSPFIRLHQCLDCGGNNPNMTAAPPSFCLLCGSSLRTIATEMAKEPSDFFYGRADGYSDDRKTRRKVKR